MAPYSEIDSEPDFSDSSVEDFNLDTIDIYPQHEVCYKERFDAARVEIPTMAPFTNDGEVEAFLHRYDDIAPKSLAKAGGNLLHTLIEVVKHIVKVKPEGVELLIWRIVQKWPSHLMETDEDGHNPLFTAVKNNQPTLVNYMVSACTDRRCLESALTKKAQGGLTCLHLALKEHFSPDTTKLLIKTASQEALAVQDDLGMTPMHYAVSFGQCDVRAELIDLFIERDIEALQKSAGLRQTFLDLRATSGRSVYSEHLNNRQVPAEEWNAFLASSSRQNAKALNKQSQTVWTAPRDLLDKAREPLRQRSVVEPNDKRSTNGCGRMGDVLNALDELEMEHQKGRSEEDANKKVGEEIGKKAEETKYLGGGEIGEKQSVSGQQVIWTGTARRSYEPAPNTPIKRDSAVSFDNNIDQKRERDEGAARPQPQPRGSSNSKDRMPLLLRSSDALLLKLKLHYMRTRSVEMAILFLYDKNHDDVQIGFDYDRLPRNMLWNEFVKRFGSNAKSGLRFDPVLQYVTFPRVQVTLKGRKADLERESEARQGGKLGRKDMEYFFDWLYQKGVRHIIRVSVEDSADTGERVHSDQAIQKSLERFIVENLDWSKTDLDPETILDISSKVEKASPSQYTENPGMPQVLPDRQLRQLSLRWSGSNAVLRGWGEPEGLASLPHLRRIVLCIPPANKRYENEPWIDAKIRNFTARLNANRQAARAQAQTQARLQPEHSHPSIPNIGGISGAFVGNVEVAKGDWATDGDADMASLDAPNLNASALVNGGKKHQWLESTAKFAHAMTPFWETTVNEFLESRQNRGPLEGVENDVVVALIDDGVDRFDSPNTHQILNGKSFDFHGGTVRPSFTSAKGHGTVMASMILQVCPMAKVYPIRLKTYENAGEKNMDIDAGYAAQAIEAALDKNVTIISMSWTIPMTEHDREANTRLHAALEKAVNRGVLMFCSAPDEGKFFKFDYPSGPWREKFLRIGAADSDGTVFRWTAEDGITYIVPGVDVTRDQAIAGSFNAHLNPGITNRMVGVRETGSDVATALAAGLAAMLIYCVKASVLIVMTANTSNNPLLARLPDTAAKDIAHPAEMKRAFACLGKVTPNNFIQVWEKLDRMTEQLEALQCPGAAQETKLACTKAFLDFGQRLWSAAKEEH